MERAAKGQWSLRPDGDAPEGHRRCEVAEAVKGDPDLQLTKVIAMSGRMTEDELKGLTARRLAR